MRIAHVLSNRGPIGGAERVCVSLVEEGSARGWPQIVINPFASDSVDTPLHEAVTPVPYVGIPCPSGRSLWAMRRRTRTALRDFEPDLVHVHMFHALVTVTTIRRAGEVRLLTHHHGRLLLSQGRRLEAVVDRVAGRRYDRIVACSNDVQRFLERSYRYPPSKVLTIHNGWEGVAGPALRDRGRARVVCVANLRPEKGHDVLIRAWRQVAGELPDAQLHLVGGGPLDAELRHRVDAEGLRSSVTFAGPVRDVWPHLAEADVFVLPTLHEPFGIVALEAMAAGLPVIASAVGGLPEFVEPGVNGVLVPAGDAAALAGELLALLRSPEERERLGRAGIERARNFTMTRTIDQYLRLYSELDHERRVSRTPR